MEKTRNGPNRINQKLQPKVRFLLPRLWQTQSILRPFARPMEINLSEIAKTWSESAKFYWRRDISVSESLFAFDMGKRQRIYCQYGHEWHGRYYAFYKTG